MEDQSLMTQTAKTQDNSP